MDNKINLDDDKIEFEDINGVNNSNASIQSNHSEIKAYVEKLLEAGKTKQEIKEQLTAVGWSENQIDAIYSQALIEKGVPLPDKAMKSTFGKKSSTVEVVINLFSFILLGIVAGALGTLFYGIINRYFPDTLRIRYYSYVSSSSSIHYAIASLLVGFPLYYLSMHLWFRGFAKDKAKTETRLTKWLTYLVLLIASVTILGDLIAVIYTFLQGGMGVRFFLKALTIIIIAGIIFAFYYLERKKIQYRQSIPPIVFKSFGISVSLIIIVGIILGFLAGGSPATERKRGFDNQRARNLSSLSNCIEQYAKEYKRLPATLSELKKSSYTYCADKKDPATGIPYEYNIINASRKNGKNIEGDYQLCGFFALNSENNSPHVYIPEANDWAKHTVGRNCRIKKVVLDHISIPIKPPIYKIESDHSINQNQNSVPNQNHFSDDNSSSNSNHTSTPNSNSVTPSSIPLN